MSELMWGIYKIFHDPPQSPKEVKCIGCKVASGCACLASAGVCGYGTFKSYLHKPFKATSLAILAFCLAGAGSVAFKMASDDHKYNQRLIANHKEYLRSKKQESREGNNHNKNLNLS